MKTEDIKKMAQAWKQVQEASYGKKKMEASDTQMGTITVKTDAERKARAQAYRDKKKAETNEAMDPVNPKELKGKHKDRKDKDINNDGKVDSTDKYLHNRRKTVSAAIKGKKNGQEVEVQTSEAKERKISPGMRALIDIGNKKAAATAKEVPASTAKAYAAIVAKRKEKMKKEEVELDEAFDIQVGSKVAIKQMKQTGKLTYLYGKVIEKEKVMGKPGVVIKWSNGVTGRFSNDQFAVLHMDRKADFVISDVISEKHQLAKEAKDHGNMNNGSPAGEGLSPSAKDQLAKKTPAPSDAFDANMVNKKTFDAMRASAKKAPMRNNDNAQGDKTPPKAK